MFSFAEHLQNRKKDSWRHSCMKSAQTPNSSNTKTHVQTTKNALLRHWLMIDDNIDVSSKKNGNWTANVKRAKTNISCNLFEQSLEVCPMPQQSTSVIGNVFLLHTACTAPQCSGFVSNALPSKVWIPCVLRQHILQPNSNTSSISVAVALHARCNAQHSSLTKCFNATVHCVNVAT